MFYLMFVIVWMIHVLGQSSRFQPFPVLFPIYCVFADTIYKSEKSN